MGFVCRVYVWVRRLILFFVNVEVNGPPGMEITGLVQTNSSYYCFFFCLFRKTVQRIPDATEQQQKKGGKRRKTARAHGVAKRTHSLPPATTILSSSRPPEQTRHPGRFFLSFSRPPSFLVPCVLFSTVFLWSGGGGLRPGTGSSSTSGGGGACCRTGRRRLGRGRGGGGGR